MKTTEPQSPQTPGAGAREVIEGEQRANERRRLARLEADRAVEQEQARQAETARAKLRAEQARKELAPKIARLRSDQREPAENARRLAGALRSIAARIEAAAGDLEGASITAGDLARNDPQRAIDTLNRAIAAFQTEGGKAAELIAGLNRGGRTKPE